MIQKDEVKVLKAEIKALKKEVNVLMEFISAMYCMMNEEEGEYEEPPGFVGSSGFGRYNT